MSRREIQSMPTEQYMIKMTIEEHVIRLDCLLSGGKHAYIVIGSEHADRQSTNL